MVIETNGVLIRSARLEPVSGTPIRKPKEAFDSDRPLLIAQRTADSPAIDETMIMKLIEQLTDKDPEVIRSANSELIRMGQAAVPFLVKGLKHENINIRSECMRLINFIGNTPAEAIPALIEKIGSVSNYMSGAAISILGKMGAQAQSAAPRIIFKLEELIARSKVQRVEGEEIMRPIEALGLIGGESSLPVVPILLKLIKDPDTDDYGIRGSAVLAQSRIAPNSEECYSVIRQLFEENCLCRTACVAALANIGSVSKEKAPEIIAALRSRQNRDSSLDYEIAVLEALVSLGQEEFTQILKTRKGISDLSKGRVPGPSEGETYNLIRGMDMIADLKDRYSVNVLRRMMGGEYWQAPGDAAEALAKLKNDPRVLPILVLASGHTSQKHDWGMTLQDGVSAALKILNINNVADTVPDLIARLKSDDAEVVLLSIQALTYLKCQSSEYLSFLINFDLRDRNVSNDLRITVIDAIESVGKQARTDNYVAYLIDCIKSKDVNPGLICRSLSALKNVYYQSKEMLKGNVSTMISLMVSQLSNDNRTNSWHQYGNYTFGYGPVSLYCAMVLGELGPEAKSALPALRKMLKEYNNRDGYEMYKMLQSVIMFIEDKF
ncbi:MAG: HEAT repeat domain-containing protein [Candidatus Margulisiibacteriota bacterium]